MGFETLVLMEEYAGYTKIDRKSTCIYFSYIYTCGEFCKIIEEDASLGNYILCLLNGG